MAALISSCTTSDSDKLTASVAATDTSDAERTYSAPIQTTESIADSYGQEYQDYVDNLNDNGYSFPDGTNPTGPKSRDENVCSYLRSGNWNVDTLVRLGKVTTEGDEEGDRIKAMVPFMCPDQQSKVDAAVAGNSPQESFVDGSYIVSEEYTPGQWKTTTVQPGTWTTRSSVDNCYWERGDGNGNIIDNNFVTFAPSITVQILETDGTFVSRGCGQWLTENQ